MKNGAKRLKEQEMEKQKDEKMRRIKELKKQQEEFETAQEIDHEEQEMSVQEDDEQESDDAQWAEYEAQEAAWTSQKMEKKHRQKIHHTFSLSQQGTHQKMKARPRKEKLPTTQAQRQKKQIQRMAKKQQAKT